MTQELQAFSLKPRNLEEALKYAEMISKSGLVPDIFKNKAGDILIACQMGEEIGLSPMQSLQNIAIIQGKPCVYGDSLMAIALKHPDCEAINETVDPAGQWAECRVQRKGHALHVVRFTMADAKAAGLDSKPGPWKNYPKRMLQMRARSYALRDKFADALRGMIAAEEAGDIIQMTAEVMKEPQALPEAPTTPENRPETPVSAALAPKQGEATKDPKIGKEDRLKIVQLAKDAGLTVDAVKTYLKMALNADSTADVTESQLPALLDWIQEQKGG